MHAWVRRQLIRLAWIVGLAAAVIVALNVYEHDISRGVERGVQLFWLILNQLVEPIAALIVLFALIQVLRPRRRGGGGRH